MIKERLYEVETRVYFNSQEEAFNMLPFLKECLVNTVEWETSMYGTELFKSDKILRTSMTIINGITRYYIGYKEEDLGRFYNIRKELDEEITSGLNNSYILELLNGREHEISWENASHVFESLGHKKFMSFTGNSQLGRCEKLQIGLKLLYCSILRYPLLLEIEKSAQSLEEAFQKEQELKDFLTEYNLQYRALKEEPTTLLFETL